ncbi:uncharacterized protein V6R79_013012 [Siganus canaliculatus]
MKKKKKKKKKKRRRRRSGGRGDAGAEEEEQTLLQHSASHQILYIWRHQQNAHVLFMEVDSPQTNGPARS